MTCRSSVVVAMVWVSGCVGELSSPPDASSLVADAATDASTLSDSGTSIDAGSPLDAGAGSDLFMAQQPWTRSVAQALPSARSDAIISAWQSLGGWGHGSLQIDFTIPLFFADTSTPRKTISANGTYCYGGPDCDAVPMQMPVPLNANIEGSNSLFCDTSYATDGQGDCHLLVVERSEKKLYELYNSTASGNGIVALGAFVWDLTVAYPDAPRGEQCTSADAAGMPIAGLLVTADEVARGTVSHALRFILPNPRMKAGVYVHPASHAGGPSSTNPNAPPYGVRIRLKASVDESPFNVSERVVLRAMKTYGLILSDGGNIALTFADDRTSTAKWASLGITPSSFSTLPVTAFEVVELGNEIAVTNDCVRRR